MEEIKLVKDIRSLGRKKVTLQEIGNFYAADDYDALRGIVLSLIKDEILKPVKSGGTNGKTPALSLSYRVDLPDEDDSELIHELKYKLSTRLDTSYYLKNIKRYKQDREHVMKLSAYLMNFPDKLSQQDIPEREELRNMGA